MPTFADSGCVAWSAQRIPTAVNLGFLDPEPLLFHSSSSLVILTRLSGPVPDPPLFRKFGSVGNRTRDLGSVARKVLHRQIMTSIMVSSLLGHFPASDMRMPLFSRIRFRVSYILFYSEKINVYKK
jgi:hypothetical protein